MKMPCIEAYMVPMPLTMSEDRSVKLANALMTSALIRHLPVLDIAGDLIGVVTDREIKVGLLFPGPGELLLKDVIAKPPYIVKPNTPLDEVVFEMMEHKQSCAVIEDENEKLVGIFTEIDALRAFHEVLGNLYTGRTSVAA